MDGARALIAHPAANAAAATAIGRRTPYRAASRPLAAPVRMVPISYSETVQPISASPPISATSAGSMVATSRLSAAWSQTPAQTRIRAARWPRRDRPSEGLRKVPAGRKRR